MRRLLIAFSGALAAACGPSFHAIYEGNARFEHCYALEENPQHAMHEKADCWRDWTEHYTYGQTRDRIHYATARYVALSQAPALPTDEALMMAAPGMTPRVQTIAAPAPTSALAPPPKVFEHQGDAGAFTGREKSSDLTNAVPEVPSSTGSPPALSAKLPQSGCTSTCENAFKDCGGGARCDDKNAQGVSADTKKKCETCSRSYGACMRSCFK